MPTQTPQCDPVVPHVNMEGVVRFDDVSSEALSICSGVK